MKKYRVSVCKGPDCRRNGSEHVFLAAKEEVQRLGLQVRCELYRGGCYGLCDLGPNCVIREADPARKKDPFSPEDFQLMGWPDEVHYPRMTPEKMVRVLREHVDQDRPVEELRAHGDDPEPHGG
ncbi:MAG: (2Fe-2S) ferredoxin domain-containing protein [Myxococcaceae bacterium]|nr:(2Fe-2S) ferredoxin domain-containing protein [Myxococcaceae bacterium]